MISRSVTKNLPVAGVANKEEAVTIGELPDASRPELRHQRRLCIQQVPQEAQHVHVQWPWRSTVQHSMCWPVMS